MSAAADQAAVIDDIDRHMAQAGSIERAAVPPGIYLAWCVNLSLAAERFLAEHEADLLRLRMRDIRPGEFFIRAAAGTLRTSHLNETGLAFTRRYYDRYLDDLAAAQGVSRDDVYTVADSWEAYDRVAAELTRLLYAPERSVRTLANWWRDFRGRFNG